MELLKEPQFAFAVGLVSGVALGYSALKWLDQSSSSSSIIKPASSVSSSDGSGLSDLYVIIL